MDIFEIKMVTDILGIIPARYASTRFPGKPLATLGNKPMIQWVYESAASVFEYLVVATDDTRIFQAVESFGGNAVMTSEDHRTGTERCEEAFRKYRERTGIGFSHVVNIQGDEPLIKPEQLKELVACFQDEEVGIATMIQPIRNRGDLENPNVVKVVVDENFNALYFSRAAIPYVRDGKSDSWFDDYPFYAHIGLYAFRSEILQWSVTLSPTSLELAESLEQLRWLQQGMPIRTRVTLHKSPGVDTPEDLEKIRSLI